MKTEPEEWSWEQQLECGAKGVVWNGVRNFQAAKNLKNMKVGDECFFLSYWCRQKYSWGGQSYKRSFSR